MLLIDVLWDNRLSVLAVALLLVAYQVVQRLFFHPLSGVPGPWYAAISSFYEFWGNCIENGRYMFYINDMHDRYGPVVRINPWEVHIRDPYYYDTLLSNPHIEKDPFYYGGFGTPDASVATLQVSKHRMRRAALAPFFSKANVIKLESRTLYYVELLCNRINEHRKIGKAVDLSNAFRSLATDVITDYAAPVTRTYLSQDDFAATEHGAIRAMACVFHWNRHMRFCFPLVRAIPRWFVALFDKSGAVVALIDNQAELLSQAKAVVAKKTTKENTVLGAIVESPLLPPAEKELHRVFDETVVIIGAGTETTGNTLAVLTYHVLANPDIHNRLKSDLRQAAARHGIQKDELLTCKAVEPLPYLQAIVKEGLRMATGVAGRLPRRHPTETLSYTDRRTKQTYVFPPNTTISMSLRDIHYDPEIFHDPQVFDPSRWLVGTAEDISSREKHMVAFGKGVRQCVGLELAKQEILLVVANLVWKFDLELFETGPRDISMVHDFFSPFGPADSKGLQVKAKLSY